MLIGLFVMAAVATSLFGCAATGGRRADRALRSGDYDTALRLLTTESVEHPGDAKVWARLGEAQYRLGHLDAARESLQKALDLDGDLYSAHLFLGYIAEKNANYDLALWHYQIYADREGKSREAKEAWRRIEALRQERAKDFAEEQIAKERELSPATYPDSTIGVVYFRSERLPDSLRPLTKGLAEMTVTDLSKVPQLQVVERLKTEKLLEELKLSNTSAFDTTKAPRLGKLLGASQVLGGDVSDLTESRLRFDPQIVSSKTGEVSLPEEQVGYLREFFKMQKQMVFDVLDKLGIALTAQARDSLAHIPTESFDAFMAYSRGLDYRDRGEYDAAKNEFALAVKLDPGFQEAAEQQREVNDLSGTGIEQPVDLETFSAETSQEPEWRASAGNTDQRLHAQLNNTGLVRVGSEAAPGIDDSPNTPPEDTEATVIVRGRFDD
jgi:tetratricopeptide (TPR) repeat protein